MSPHDVTVSVTPNKAVNKQSSLCENKKNIPNNVRAPEKREKCHQKKADKNNNNDQFDTSFLPESVHGEFVQAAKPFLSPVEISNLWKRVLIVHKKTKIEQSLNDVIGTVIVCL